MIVERITSLQGFESVRSAYEELCERDPHRTVFVCWNWLRAYITALQPRWTLLCVRDGPQPIGFCFLVERGIKLGPVHLYRELALGAYPAADYASLVIGEGEKSAVLRALAGAIACMRWDVFRACNVNDVRVRILVKRLARMHEVTVEAQNPSRFLPLPAAWTEYAARASAGDRSARHIVKRSHAWPGSRFVEAHDASIDDDIEALLQLRHFRWRGSLRSARRTYGRLFREAYAQGCCRLGVLRSAEGRPLAAQAAFVDCAKRTWVAYTVAHDTRLERQFLRRRPGIVMMASGIEHAVAQGFRCLDFGRGDERYKCDLGSKVQMLDNFIVRRRSLRSRVAESLWTASGSTKALVRRVVLGRTR